MQINKKCNFVQKINIKMCNFGMLAFLIEGARRIGKNTVVTEFAKRTSGIRFS